MNPTPMETPEQVLLDRVRRAGPGEPWDPRSVVFTGSELRRVELPDQTVVLKRLDKRGDWLSRATNGVGRTARLWTSGLLREIEPVVEHGVIGVIERDEHDVLVMHDLSSWLIPPEAWVDDATIDAVLCRMARLHDHAVGIDVEGLCSTFERANFCNPAFHELDAGPNPIRAGARGLRDGYQFIRDRLGAEASAFIASYYENARSLAQEVERRTTRPTLLHGDTKLENLGVRDDRLAAIDWGELTGRGPAEIDVVTFALGSCWFQTDLTPLEVYERYDRHSTVGLDEELLDLSLRVLIGSRAIGSLGSMARHSDPEMRDRAKARFFGILAELDRSFR